MSLPACGFSELVNDAPTLLTNKSQQENASGIKAATATKELRWAAGLDTEGSSTPAAAVSRKPGRLGTPWHSDTRAALDDVFGPRDNDFGPEKRLAFAAELPGAIESSMNHQTSLVRRTGRKATPWHDISKTESLECELTDAERHVCWHEIDESSGPKGIGSVESGRRPARKGTPWHCSPKRSEEDEEPSSVKHHVRWAKGVDVLAIPHRSSSEAEMKATLSRRSKRRGTPFPGCYKSSVEDHDDWEDVDSAEESHCPQQSQASKRKPVRRATPWALGSKPSEQVDEPRGCIRWAATDPLEAVQPSRRSMRKGTPWHGKRSEAAGESLSMDQRDELSANCTREQSRLHGTDRQSVKPDANGPYLWMPFKVPSWLQCCSPVEEKGSEIFLAATDIHAEY